jgi:hypothetical protein
VPFNSRPFNLMRIITDGEASNGPEKRASLSAAGAIDTALMPPRGRNFSPESFRSPSPRGFCRRILFLISIPQMLIVSHQVNSNQHNFLNSFSSKRTYFGGKPNN